jgi:hypothetical protein
MELTDKDYQQMTQMVSFLSGVVKLAQDRGFTPEQTSYLAKQAAASYSQERFGENLLDRWSQALVKTANGMGMGGDPTGGMSPTNMAPPGTDPNQLAKQQQGPQGAGNIEDPEDAALRAKPVPTNPFDFRNHPAILQMQKRQRDLLLAKKKELEQTQNHTSGLF